MRTRMTAVIFALCVTLFTVLPARAEIWLDPEPPLTWDATIACELVVLAKYDSHEAGELKLQVLEVLKGKVDLKKPLGVKLAHLYSVETGPVGWDRHFKQGEKKELIPKVCYKQQFNNPGGLEPNAVRSDAREPAIYFFPSSSDPVLKVQGQIHGPQSQKGWQQALDHKPIDLLFRLMQYVNRELSREALEELGKTRDSAAIDQLFAWVIDGGKDAPFNTYRAAAFLIRLGDCDGDIYDRASKLLASAAPGKEEYWHLRLATIMAVVDHERAMVDLRKMLGPENRLPARQAAVYGLGRIPRREAAQIAMDSLRESELADFAVGSLHNQLDGESGNGLPRCRGLENDQEWLVETLKAAFIDERVTDKTKKQIRDYFWDEIRERPPLNLEVLRTIMLNPKDVGYKVHDKGSPPPQVGDEKTANLLRDAREACDPRMIPILVEVLEKVPAASGNHAHAFQETLKHYARICPRAMKKEFVRRGFPENLPPPDPGYGIPLGIRDAMEATKIWPSRNKPYLEDEIAKCYTLAAEIRGGKSDEVGALVKAVDALHTKHENRGQAAFPALLDSGAPAARDRFFAYLNKAKQGRLNRWTNQITLSDVSDVISPLHEKHPQLHVDLVLELLKSKSLAEREAGAACLSSAWRSDFGFDHEALEAERSRRLAEVEPFIRKVAAASDTEARVMLLERAGFVVSGKPNDAWLPTLLKAAGTRGEAATHAMRLVEAVMEEEQYREFAHLPPPQRVRALRAYLADAGKLP